MNRLKKSKELLEAASIFNALLVQEEDDMAKQQQAAKAELTTADNVAENQPFRGDQLENVLYGMCQRGGFQGAAVADEQGLALAIYNSPVEGDVLAAFTTVLGEAIGKAGRFLEQHDANNISLDINFIDKAVVRQFSLGDNSFYILVICGQEIDERSEIELSIKQVTAILEKH
ncbi:MAG: hypothetical protein KKD01_16730 [Proteobacteria bacterium]|nr:hypothetical protein [Pseudomonadota bacterium]MBU1420426.1 hypothetical protein [Pseudomonadota bacterium]MBU1456371.1 hypothetical protein [Pseudomonadota bacterium]